MDDIRVRLERVTDALGGVLGDMYADHAAPVDDTELLSLARSAADVLRRAEGVLVHVTGEIQERSASPVREERLTTRAGCRSVSCCSPQPGWDSSGSRIWNASRGAPAGRPP